MPLLRQILFRLQPLFRKKKIEAEMSEEMRMHLEMATEANVAAGMSPAESRSAARREFGGIDQIKEAYRDQRGLRWLEDTVRDVRYAVRQLAKSPGFTAVVAATLALGIGINTVVFSFYEAVVLKPLAVAKPDAVVRLVTTEGRQWNDTFAYSEIEDIQARATSFSAVTATSPHQIMLVEKSDAQAGGQETFGVRLVSANYFAALGVAPVLGRGFGAGDMNVGILSFEAWRRRFNADPAVLGQTLRVQNVVVTIIGVAPKSFAGTGRPAAAPDLWLPLALQPAVLPTVDWLHDPTVRQWQLIARCKPGIRLEQAVAELGMLGHDWRQSEGREWRLAARKATLFEVDYLEFNAVCAVVMAAVGLILLIGCVNVVNLLSARNAAREHELAVRLALGAGRRRLVRQLCTESILLGLLGGAGGLLLSVWCCDFLSTWIGGLMQRLSGGAVSVFLDVTPDGRVLAYALVASLFAGVVAGIWPAIRATGGNLDGALKQEASGVGAPTRGPWSRRNLLLTAQVAMSLLLLAGAGLLFRGAAHALTTDPGFDAKHLFLMRINPDTAAPTAGAHTALLHEVVARISALPEVDSVAWSDHAPYMGHSIGWFETDDGRRVNDCVTLRGTASYFGTLGIPLVAGRTFTAEEETTRAPVVVISQSAAHRLWPGKDPLGRRMADAKPAKDGGRNWFVVIGVVKDTRLTLLSQVDAADLFFPQPVGADGLFLVHTRSAPEAAFSPTWTTLRRLSATLPSQTLILSMEQGPMQFQRLWAEWPATFASVLGLIALLLSAVGIYGVVSFLVARRTREIGIHLALGAQKRDVVGLVLRQTLRPVVWGASVGLLGATGLSVLLTRLVLNPEIPDLTYGAGAFPSATLLGVLGLLLGVILLAAFIPARRATRVDPIVALRAE